MDYGLVHIYCGDGKGKTTAALGGALRLAGAGRKVCFCQFMKDGTSSEIKVLQGITGIDVVCAVNTFGFTWKMTDSQKQSLREINNRTLEDIINRCKDGLYQMVVLDEIVSAYNNELVDRRLVQDLLNLAKNRIEVVMTGRNSDKALLDQADYITEMKAIRHPYEKGINARIGIEK